MGDASTPFLYFYGDSMSTVQALRRLERLGFVRSTGYGPLRTGQAGEKIYIIFIIVD